MKFCETRFDSHELPEGYSVLAKGDYLYHCSSGWDRESQECKGLPEIFRRKQAVDAQNLRRVRMLLEAHYPED